MFDHIYLQDKGHTASKALTEVVWYPSGGNAGTLFVTALSLLVDGIWYVVSALLKLKKKQKLSHTEYWNTKTVQLFSQ